MAKQHTTPPNNRPTRSRASSCSFLACFGFSELPDTMINPPPTKPAAASDNNPGKRKKSRWLSWPSRLRVKIKSAAKTVPVVDPTNNSSDKHESVDKISAPPPSKSNPSIKLKTPKPEAKKIVRKRQPPPPDQATPTSQTSNGPARNTVLEKRRESDSANDTAGQKRMSFCRKLESIRTRSSSQPGSPVHQIKPHNNSSSSTRRIGRAISHPANFSPSTATTLYHKPASPAAGKRNYTAEKMDPVLGMSIILVTLIIMLLWGRVCAILSTSAWFYFIPRLRKSVKSSTNNQGRVRTDSNHRSESIWDDQDLSYEDKKRVVLEGFLERNHRSS